jgi:acetyl/propionyl-CoA carboxylase alpha subunit
VEHPVTEWVTGFDLVRAQIDIARGARLGPEFDAIEPRGHAFEVRIYAEDPYRNFAPSPGRVRRLRWPDGPGVRVDSGVYEGDEVTIHYDPLLAKLTVWGSDRGHALNRLDRALAELRIEGIRTTVPLFQALLEDDDFRRGELDIEMLDRKLSGGELRAERPVELADLGVVAAALEHVERTSRAAAVSPPARRDRWRRAGRREGLR